MNYNTQQHNTDAINAAIIGAAGYAGAELTRLLLSHPRFSLKIISSQSLRGQRLADVYPAFQGVSNLFFSEHDILPFIKDEDVKLVFLAVPHTTAMNVAPELLAQGVSVVDLSADFRLKDADTFEKWYDEKHSCPQLLEQVVFGLPELYPKDFSLAAKRVADKKQVLVSCAGCYPTASSLAAFPAMPFKKEDADVVVNAISGVSGAGRSANSTTHFCNANENIRAYSVGCHRHTPEISQILDANDQVVFVPHLSPVNRGILSTVCMRIDKEKFCKVFGSKCTIDSVCAYYKDFYKGCEFIRVLDVGKQAQTSSVLGTNYAHISLAKSANGNNLIVTCAIDNLCKGAAGQAVQCANLVYGLPESLGLEMQALPV